jgi:hypothetical protein
LPAKLLNDAFGYVKAFNFRNEPDLNKALQKHYKQQLL